MTKVLVLGAGGMLGGEILDYFSRVSGYSVKGLSHTQNVPFEDVVMPYLSTKTYDWCINCAAFTDTAGAETSAEKQLESTYINAVFPAKLAIVCRDTDTRLVHFSTDYVFGGGERVEPIPDYARPAPLGIYGMHKLLGERGITAAFSEGSAILRTSWLYGRRGEKSFVHRFSAALMKALAEGRTLEVPDDEVSVPTSVKALVGAAGEAVRSGLSGVMHAVPLPNCHMPSRYDWAKEIGAWFAGDWRRRKEAGQTSPAEDAVWPKYSEGAIKPKPGGKTDAWRPGYSAMKTSELLLPCFRGWRTHLLEFLETGGCGAEWSRKTCGIIFS